MANFLAEFFDGPMNMQVLRVCADPLASPKNGKPERPALWQEFRRELTSRFGGRVGRVGIFLYRLSDRPPGPGGIWSYDYVQYGEAFDDYTGV